MSASSRFAVAVHILALLAMNPDQPITSDDMAASVNTHPVVIRRILGALRKAGLTTAQPGAGGGASLSCRPEQVTLLDVYRAVETGDVFSLHRRTPNAQCLCGRNIQAVLEGVFDQTEAAMEKTLTQVTVAQITQQIEALATCHSEP